MPDGELPLAEPADVSRELEAELLDAVLRVAWQDVEAELRVRED